MAKAKASYLDRPLVFWDGEGLTLEHQGGPTRRQWRDEARAYAERERHYWDDRVARIEGPVLQLGGIVRDAGAKTRYDGVPAKYLRPPTGTYGNLDLVAQLLESETRQPWCEDDVLEELASIAKRPTLKALEAEFYARNAHRAPQHGRHIYSLLANSTGSFLEDYDRGLGTRACLDFLLEVARANPRAVHVGFALGYDFDMMLGDCSREDVRRLRSQIGQTAPVRIWVGGQYRVTYRPRKFLRVARGRESVTLYDVFGFFQASFVRACTDWLSKETLRELGMEDIHAMKLRRATFTQDDRDDVRAYCFAELRAGVALVDELRARVKETGIPMNRLDGAGALAAGIYTQQRVKAHLAPDPEEHRHAIASAYFGGRIEMAKLGNHRGAAFEYDVRSAYPAAIAQLPDLAGAEWVLSDCPQSPWFLACVDWEFPLVGDDGKRVPFYPLPYRRADGAVLFPPRGTGWVWHPEYRAARDFEAAIGGRLDASAYLSLIPADATRRPFWFVPELYATRARWKREGRGAEKVLKLGLNSLYGKMAQQVGARLDLATGAVVPPPFFSLAWAGIVTSTTRAQLLTAALADPHAIAMFMTDGLYSTAPLPLELGPGLGQWEEAPMDGLVIAQPGVYWKRHGDRWDAKVRGFNVETLTTPDRVLEAWEREGPWAKLEVPTTRFVTAGTALASEAAWATWRRWITEPRVLALSGASEKRGAVAPRSHPERFMRPLDVVVAQHDDLSAGVASTPYDVAFWRGARRQPDLERSTQEELEMLYE